MRWLIFNFDGTWNGRSDDFPTNVLLFHESFGRPEHVSFYFSGPGDEDEHHFLGQYLGGALGFGCRSIRDQAMETLESVYRDGDQIAVSGFSRGAAIARMFAALLAREGKHVSFLGVWDTVFGRLPFGRFQQDTLFGDLRISDNVKNAFHAVALDDDRRAFAPNLMDPRDGVTEVWFRGNHADIGGGYEERGLANITLGWMCANAGKCGLLVKPDLPDSPAIRHYEDGVWRRQNRVPPDDAVIHESACADEKTL